MPASNSLASAEKEIRKCIKCGNCRAVCPVFGETGTESGVARGKIRLAEAIINDELEANPEIAKRLDLCLACKACVSNCPSGVRFDQIILAAREEIAKKRHHSLTELAAKPWRSPLLFKITSNRKIFHSLLRAAGKAQKPLVKGQPVMRHLPLGLSELTSYRSLPVISDRPFRDIIKNYRQEIPVLKGKLVFYSGCAIDFAYPEVGVSLVKVLNRRGYEVLFPQGQACCGTPLRYMGDINPVKKMACDNILAVEKMLREENAVGVITACPTCTGAWVHDYPNLFKDEPEWLKRIEYIEEKMVEFTRFVSANQLSEQDKGYENRQIKQNVRLTYHDSCHMKRHLGIFNEPREILKGLAGAEFVEMPKADACCGCGGSFSLKFPEVSAGILSKKLANIKKTGADFVVTGCPGCLMQLKGGLDKAGQKTGAMHIAEVMARLEEGGQIL